MAYAMLAELPPIYGLYACILNIVIKLFFTDLRNQFNWWAFLIGTSATVILYAMKKLNKKYLPKKPLPVEVVLLPNRNA